MFSLLQSSRLEAKSSLDIPVCADSVRDREADEIKQSAAHLPAGNHRPNSADNLDPTSDKDPVLPFITFGCKREGICFLTFFFFSLSSLYYVTFFHHCFQR